MLFFFFKEEDREKHFEAKLQQIEVNIFYVCLMFPNLNFHDMLFISVFWPSVLNVPYTCETLK